MKPVRFALFLLLPLSALAGIERAQIDFDFVRQLAASRAAVPYVEQADPMPRRLAELTPAEASAIRFIPEYALWRSDRLPFQLQLFHPLPGSPPVGLNEFSVSHVQPLPFVGSFFSYGMLRNPPRPTPELGYSGFRVHNPLNRPEHFDELIVFPGACTFRALGAGQNFGLSARALALDAGPLSSEEFPRFTEFWIGRPKPADTSLTLYALLESPRAVGAYEFIVTPGPTTVVAVRAAITFRATVAQPGFAPLSGMFWYGENSDRPAGEPCPEVHEADGLAIRTTDGTCYWRPLQNPSGTFGSGIAVESLNGFGLLQRDRVFEHYGDLDADYHRRPSVWVEPLGDWGPGRVQLVETPSRSRFDANITAFWVPDRLPAPGTPFELRYRLHWTETEPAAVALAPTVATHVGALPERPLGRLFWIDFAGPSLARLDNGALDAEIRLGPGAKLLRQSVRKNPVDASWRVAIEIEAEVAGRAVELRCRLREGYTPVSETWVYSWMP
jgi:periplasmic glucans biosynthesis protein